MNADNRPHRHYADLHALVETFEEMGELKKVDGVHWNLEMGALTETLASELRGRTPALLFDKIVDYPAGFRLLSGGANSYRRLAYVLGFPEPSREMDLVHAYRQRLKDGFELIPPRIVKGGPVLENIDREQDVNLYKFPVPFLHERDGGRYIGTDDLVVMRDPETGWVNMGTYRVMVHDRNSVGIWISPGKHGRLIRDKYFEQKQSCPVLISCGHDPLLHLSANQEVDYQVSEYDYAGGICGQPIDVVKSELYELPMPAHAEIVLEGEIHFDKVKEEGPFGEFMGYYASTPSEQPLVTIRRVYYRNDPILTVAIPCRPPQNFTFARAQIKAAMMWNEMEAAGVPGINGIWCHEGGAGRLFNVISIKQLYAGHATQAALLAASCHAGNYAGRWVIVVDEDIDPSNVTDVIWALSTRCDPPDDVQFLRKAWSTPLDPMLRNPPYQNNRAIVDACRPYGWKSEFPTVAEASPELKQKVRKKYSHLFPS